MIYSRFIGVDGCKAGWFYVSINVLGESDFGAFKTLPELCHANKKDTLILVDIPIGLPSKKNLSRECDTMARKLLSPLRHSSVFSPPCRATLYKANYAEACDINAAVTGRKISLQAWNIAAKIREVDNLLQDHPKARAVIRECPPALCIRESPIVRCLINC